MVRPALRTRLLRKVKKTTPGGKRVIHYEKRRPNPAVCAICKKPLKGVPRLRPSELKKLPKTKKRPERPYGGYLCSSCMKSQIKEKKLKEWGYGESKGNN